LIKGVLSDSTDRLHPNNSSNPANSSGVDAIRIIIL
jgi:hypothetical protein